MAFLTASTPIARVVRPELRLYSVSPTPTIQYLSRRFAIRSFLSAHHPPNRPMVASAPAPRVTDNTPPPGSCLVDRCQSTRLSSSTMTLLPFIAQLPLACSGALNGLCLDGMPSSRPED